MVTTIKVLKRKDASSVVVAVVVALVLYQVLPGLTSELAATLSGNDVTTGPGWQVQYLQPVVHAVLQLVLLELVLWVWTALVASMKK